MRREFIFAHVDSPDKKSHAKPPRRKEIPAVLKLGLIAARRGQRCIFPAGGPARNPISANQFDESHPFEGGATGGGNRTSRHPRNQPPPASRPGLSRRYPRRCQIPEEPARQLSVRPPWDKFPTCQRMAPARNHQSPALSKRPTPRSAQVSRPRRRPVTPLWSAAARLPLFVFPDASPGEQKQPGPPLFRLIQTKPFIHRFSPTNKEAPSPRSAQVFRWARKTRPLNSLSCVSLRSWLNVLKPLNTRTATKNEKGYPQIDTDCSPSRDLAKFGRSTCPVIFLSVSSASSAVLFFLNQPAACSPQSTELEPPLGC